jgi:hypothetical protein
MQTPPLDPELAAAIRQAQEGDYEAAVLSLDKVARRLAAEGGHPQELGRAYVYLSIAYLGLGQEATAKARFLDALRADKDMTFTAKEFPPKILEFFERTRREAAPSAPVSVSPPLAPSPAPTSSPAATTASPAPRKGGSKTLPVLLGVAGAVGIGAAVAGGGGGGASPPPPTPSSSATPGAVTPPPTPMPTATPSPTQTTEIRNFDSPSNSRKQFSFSVARGQIEAGLTFSSPGPGAMVMYLSVDGTNHISDTGYAQGDQGPLHVSGEVAAGDYLIVVVNGSLNSRTCRLQVTYNVR